MAKKTERSWETLAFHLNDFLSAPSDASRNFPSSPLAHELPTMTTMSKKKSIRKSLSHEFSFSCHNVPHTHKNSKQEEGGKFHEAQIIFINCVSRNFGILVIDFQQALLTVDDSTSLGTWRYDMSEASTRNHPSLSFSLNHYHYSMSFNTQTETHIFHLFNSITSCHDTLDVVSGFCRRTFSLFLISFRSMYALWIWARDIKTQQYLCQNRLRVSRVRIIDESLGGKLYFLTLRLLVTHTFWENRYLI